MEAVTDFIFLGSKVTANGDTAIKLKNLCSWEGKLWRPRQYIKKQRHHFADKGAYSQIYGFSSSYLWMWELDHKEFWTPKNWCFQTVVPAPKTLENPLDSKEIKGLILKLNLQSFGHMTWGTNSSEKTLMLGKTEGGGQGGNKRWDSWMASPTLRTWVGTNSRRVWRAGKIGMMHFLGLQKSWTWLSKWTTTRFIEKLSRWYGVSIYPSYTYTIPIINILH